MMSKKMLNSTELENPELDEIYDFVLTIDNYTLTKYINEQTLTIYNNDFEIYLYMLNKLITIYEDTQQYEKCMLLLRKKNKVINELN
jgi:hypothetical protein